MITYFLSSADSLPFTKRKKWGSNGISLRYLGTAGFVVCDAQRTIVLDPFITRPSEFQTLFTRLEPNIELLKKEIPKADDVLIGHAHHDHILDAPALCHHTGARLIGSKDACNIGRAAGLPESQLRETQGREWISCGHHRIYGAPSRHGRVYFNKVPLPGTIDTPPSWPLHYSQYRHGLVLNWHLEMNGFSMVHIDSADFIPEELQNHECDLLCLCAIGRKYRPNYIKEAVRILKPKYIVPCHWDLFFTPFEGPHCLLPGVDLPGMLQEIEQEGVQSILLPIGARIDL